MRNFGLIFTIIFGAVLLMVACCKIDISNGQAFSAGIIGFIFIIFGNLMLDEDE